MKKIHNKIRLIAFLSIVVLALAACSGSAETAPNEVEAAPLDPFIPVVSATGEVVPARFSTISSTTAGPVHEVLVEEGDTVAEGTLLIQLGNQEQLEAAITAAELELANAEQALQDLYDKADLVAAQTQLALANANDDLDDAEYKWRVRQQGYRASGDTIAAAEARLTLADDQVEEAEDAYSRASGDLPKALARINLTNARESRDAALRNLNWYTGTPTELDQAVLDAELAEAQARLKDLEREWEKVKDGPNPDTTKLAEARLRNAEATLASAKAGLEDLSVRAPYDGTIAETFVRQAEWVNPGQPLLVIADLDGLQVETTDLSEIDVAQLEIGNQATITFDAIPDVVSAGEVSRIAPKVAEGAGVNYTVIIKFVESPPDDIRWGMTAFVDIDVEK